MLHRARWVLPVSAGPIAGGAVLTGPGRIVAVGPYRTLAPHLPADAPVEDHGDCAIIPALVNAHTHLELSALKGSIGLPQPGFAAWVTELFSRGASLTPEQIEQGFARGCAEALDSGTALCGDITNGRFAPARPGAALRRQVFLELLGFDCATLEAALESSAHRGLDAAFEDSFVSVCAHAAYSASPEVIRQAKDWSGARGRPFSIHTAEHPEETEFLSTGGGFCRALLERLGRWDPRWNPPGVSPVRYLDGLGVLDASTLLVHAVHLSGADWDIVSARGCRVCFCPRSNRNLNAGSPQIGRALALGVAAALGTDSLASNTGVDLFAEAAFVLENHPDVTAASALRMITLGGAEALGQSASYGSIEPGKAPALLAVHLPENTAETSLVETLVQQGNKGAFEWINRPEKS